MDRLGLPLSSGVLAWHHANSTLVISYAKPAVVMQAVRQGKGEGAERREEVMQAMRRGKGEGAERREVVVYFNAAAAIQARGQAVEEKQISRLPLKILPG